MHTDHFTVLSAATFLQSGQLKKTGYSRSSLGRLKISVGFVTGYQENHNNLIYRRPFTFNIRTDCA